jgi:tRNA dimethylallyltransferase
VVVSGGSPLYVKSLLEGLSAGTPRDDALRQRLEQRLANEGAEALFAELQRVDPEYASERHPNDHRRVMRALEVYHASGKPYSSFHTTDGQRRDDYRSLLLGIRWDKDILHKRINARCKAMFANGLVEEVRSLSGKLSAEAHQGVGYKEVFGYLNREYSLAKHQMTWLRRFHDMKWIPGDSDNVLNIALQHYVTWREGDTRSLSGIDCQVQRRGEVDTV